MNASRPNQQQYLDAQVRAASPHRLHLMVVDGAIRFAQQAITGIEAGQIDEFHQKISRARDCAINILFMLRADQQPELVESMRATFTFVVRSLGVAEIASDAQAVRDAIRVLEIHRETWIELGLRLKDAAPATSETAASTSLHGFQFTA